MSSLKFRPAEDDAGGDTLVRVLVLVRVRGENKRHTTADSSWGAQLLSQLRNADFTANSYNSGFFYELKRSSSLVLQQPNCIQAEQIDRRNRVRDR